MSNLKPITVHMDADMIKACEKLKKRLGVSQRSQVFRIVIKMGLETLLKSALRYIASSP